MTSYVAWTGQVMVRLLEDALEKDPDGGGFSNICYTPSY